MPLAIGHPFVSLITTFKYNSLACFHCFCCLLIKLISHQLGYNTNVGNHASSPAKGKVNNIHCASLVNTATHLIIGSVVGQAWYGLHKSNWLVLFVLPGNGYPLLHYSQKTNNVFLWYLTLLVFFFFFSKLNTYLFILNSTLESQNLWFYIQLGL